MDRFDPAPFRCSLLRRLVQPLARARRRVNAYRERSASRDPVAGPLVLMMATGVGGFLAAGMLAAPAVDVQAEYCRAYADGTLIQYEIIYGQLEETRAMIEAQGNRGGLAVVSPDGRLLDFVPASGEGGYFQPLAADYLETVESDCLTAGAEDFVERGVRGPSNLAVANGE